jgi:hypothetical protein
VAKYSQKACSARVEGRFRRHWATLAAYRRSRLGYGRNGGRRRVQPVLFPSTRSLFSIFRLGSPAARVGLPQRSACTAWSTGTTLGARPARYGLALARRAPGSRGYLRRGWAVKKSFHSAHSGAIADADAPVWQCGTTLFAFAAAAKKSLDARPRPGRRPGPTMGEEVCAVDLRVPHAGPGHTLRRRAAAPMTPSRQCPAHGGRVTQEA